MRSYYTKGTTTSGCRGRDLTPPWRDWMHHSVGPSGRGILAVRRNVILTAALIGAMLFGGIFIFCMIGILGMGMEMVLRG